MSMSPAGPAGIGQQRGRTCAESEVPESAGEIGEIVTRTHATESKLHVTIGERLLVPQVGQAERLGIAVDCLHLHLIADAVRGQVATIALVRRDMQLAAGVVGQPAEIETGGEHPPVGVTRALILAAAGIPRDFGLVHGLHVDALVRPRCAQAAPVAEQSVVRRRAGVRSAAEADQRRSEDQMVSNRFCGHEELFGAIAAVCFVVPKKREDSPATDACHQAPAMSGVSSPLTGSSTRAGVSARRAHANAAPTLNTSDEKKRPSGQTIRRMYVGARTPAQESSGGYVRWDTARGGACLL